MANLILFAIGASAAPNLVVTAITSPATADEAAAVSVSWTVKNIGDAPAVGPWSDRLALSPDQAIGDDSFIGLFNIPGPLAPGASYTQTQTVTLPQGIVNNAYFVVVTDAGGVVTESDESNNGLLSSVINVKPVFPDFLVEGIVLPSQSGIGQPLSLSYQVRNAGSGRAYVYYTRDRLFLSVNNVAGDGDDVSIGYSDYMYGGPTGNSYLEPGAVFNRSVSFTLPSNISGARYLVVKGDENNYVPEGAAGEANNTVVSTGTVDLIVPPDLVVESISVPSAVSIGQTIDVFWTVRNTGAGAASGPWVDEFLLSKTTAGTSPISLGTFTYTGNLAAGASYTGQKSITVPASATGTFYFLTLTDASNVVFESNNDNNKLVNSQTFTGKLPDLVLGVVTLPSTITPGQEINLGYRINNTGDGSAIGTWIDRFVLSTNSTYGDSDDIFLAQQFTSGPLAAADLVDRTIQLTVPGNIPSGDYQLIGRTNFTGSLSESSTTNNNSAPIAVTVTVPNLVLQDVVVGDDATPERTFSIGYQQRNSGNGATQTGWTDRLTLSTNLIKGDADDRVLGSFSSDVLAAGANRQVIRDVTLPSDLEVSQYLVFIDLDATNIVPETSEADNGAFTAPFAVSVPDLLISDVAAPSNGSIGKPIAVQWKASNPGDRNVPSGYRTDVVLSSDSVLGNSDDRVLAQLSSDAIVKGASSIRSAEVGIPAAAMPGDYRVFVVGDAGGAVRETDETNNAASFGPISIGGAELIASNLQAPVAAELGKPFIVSWHVENTGLRDAEARVDAIILSINEAAGDGDDRVLARVPAALLASGGSQDRSASVSLPGGITDASVRLFVRADADNAVVELNKANNLAGPSALTVAGPDLIVKKIEAPDSLRSGQSETISITVGNIGQVPTPAASELAVRLSSSPSPSGATIGTAPIAAGLAAGAEVVLSVPISLPVDYSTQETRYFVAVADAADSITETSESNQTLAKPFDLLPTPSVDLLPLAVSPPSVAEEGQSFAFTWSVKNTGEGNASGNWVDKIFLSQTPAIDGSAVLLRAVTRTGGLAAGASYLVNDQAVVPAGLDGTFYLVLRTDSENNVPEPVGESNNVRASSAFAIEQRTLPDLSLTQIILGSNRYVGQSLNVIYQVRNLGPGTVNAGWSDRVYIGSDSGGDPLDPAGLTQVAVFTRTAQVLPLFGYGETASITLPATPGRYRIVVRADDNGLNATPPGNVKDVTRSNNARVEFVQVIEPEYAAKAETVFTDGPSGSAVAITGNATRNADGGPAANADVQVAIVVREVRRNIAVRTDSQGKFTTSFQSLPTEAGRYALFAKHPASPDPAAQDTFELDGFSVSPTFASIRLLPGETRTGTFRVTNSGDAPIENFTVTLSGGASNVHVDASAPPTVPAGGGIDVAYTVNATNSESSLADTTFTLSGGLAPPLTATLRVDAGPLAPTLVATPASIVTTMVRGQQNTVEIAVKNTGGLPTGALSVAAPAQPWLFISSPKTIAPLAANAETRIVLTLLPDTTTVLGMYSGTIVVNSPTGNLAIPFSINCISAGKGTLRVTATDEFTYYGDGRPNVAGAQIILRDAVTKDLVAQATTDTTGIAEFVDLREARYDVEATKAEHGLFRGQILVNAGRVNALEAFLPRQLVSYKWTVVPTTIVDKYEIKLEATFTTNVPAPVVTVEPALVDLRNIPPEGLQVNFTIRNQGLIAAEDVALDVAGDSNVSVTPLVRTIGTLAANSSATIPVFFNRVTRRDLTSQGTPDIEVGCFNVSTEVAYAFVCGEKRGYRIPVFYQIPGCGGGGGPSGGITGGSGIAGTGVGGGGGGGGEGGPGSWTYPDLQVPQWVEQVFCCLSRNACIKSILACTPFSIASKLADWAFVSDSYEPDVPEAVKDAYEQTLEDLEEYLDSIDKLKLYQIYKCSCSITRDCVVECIFAPPGGPNACSATDVANAIAGALLMRADAPTDDIALAAMKNERERLARMMRPIARVFGDVVWLEVEDTATLRAWILAFDQRRTLESPEGEYVSETERASLLAITIPQPLTALQVNRFLDRWNRTIEYRELEIFNVGDVPTEFSTDFIAVDYVGIAAMDADRSVRSMIEEGFVYGLDAYNTSRDALEATRRSSGQGVCAQVKIKIDQELALTRDAFNATLEIENNGTSDPLTAVNAEVVIKDENGVDATDLFALQDPIATGFGGSPGSRSVAPKSVGSLKWLIVPSKDAAPTEPKKYSVSGSFTYTVNGETIRVPLYPADITVLPNPSLKLKYFLEKEVFSDDPFTPETEPSVPFSLGLLIENNGAGAAKAVQITSAQPEIIENKKGLLIDFKIIATELNSNPMTPSLQVQFGDIGPGQRKIAQFFMTSSLMGKFTTFKATFENLNGLGKPGLSIIDSVDVFPATHVVKAEDDTLPDFLTDQTADPINMPDHVHLSTGPVMTVVPVRTFDMAIDSATQSARVAAAVAPTSYCYFRIPDPFGATLVLTEVRRSDGKIIKLGANAWQTSKINRDGEGGVPAGTPERYVHIFDQAGTGSYRLSFNSTGPGPNVSALRLARMHGTDAEALIPVAANGQSVEPRAGGVRKLVVRFAEPVTTASFVKANSSLSARGSPGNDLIDVSPYQSTFGLEDGGLTGVIEFDPPLPDRTRYCLDLANLQLRRGGAAIENGRYAFVAFAGDVTGDQRVNNTDVGAVLSRRGVVVSESSALGDIRCDVNADGVINEQDLAITLAARGADMRVISDACPAASVREGDGLTTRREFPIDGDLSESAPIPVDPPSWLGRSMPEKIADAIASLDRTPRSVNSSAEGAHNSFVWTAENSRGIVCGFTGSGFAHQRAAWLGAPTQSGNRPVYILGTLGGSTSAARGINEQGILVGESLTADGRARAFLYSDRAGMKRLDQGVELIGSATDINDRNWAVGYVIAPNGRTRAVGWFGWFGALDLNALLPQGSGWELESVLGFDRSGLVVGRGRYQGQQSDFRMRLNPHDALLADVNNDGTVDVADLQSFAAAYQNGAPVGDFNGDGMADDDDVIAFAEAYAGGS
ncbi:MAG: hypothetical protein J0L78_06130 [Planctomycetes bacterium]|nr:hypothetical protein [Planctomycetota bacterium]